MNSTEHVSSRPGNIRRPDGFRVLLFLFVDDDNGFSPTSGRLARCPFAGSGPANTHEVTTPHYWTEHPDEKPLVWVFPQVEACLECGLAQFSVSETQLKLIRQNLGNDGAKAAC